MARPLAAAAWLVPGSAAYQVGRGFLALACALLAATAGVALRARSGLVPDPLSCAGTGAMAFGGAALLALLLCAALQVLSLVLLRRRH